MTRLDGCQALITGASAGIGREFARQLAGRARGLILVARRAQRLQELREELVGRHPKLRVEIHRTDLSQHDAVDELLEWVGAQNFGLDLLINNAGLGDLGAFATADPERVEQMVEVNMVALTRLTRALLPAMIERKRGAILNVSSSASFLPIPNFAVYAATKAYVTSFSEALRGELHGSGVHVSALCPGPVRTEFTEVARRRPAGPVAPEPELAYVAVEKVVTEALDGIEHNRAIVIPGPVMKLGMLIVRLTPLPLLRLGGRLFAKPAH
ncbi:MAG: SDR family NAD(P)-dependent oxidoreductase [Chthoniobacterales bacterium]